MTSERQQRANRANAKASTGPTSAAGKTLVARNALRHGLNIPVEYDPSLTPSISALARRIEGEGVSVNVDNLPFIDSARRVARAQIDLRRVRSLRHLLIASAYADPAYEPREVVRYRDECKRVLARFGDQIPASFEKILKPQLLLQGPEKMMTIIDDLAPELERLDRYEKRALSRRKFAIREFDAMKRPGSAQAPS